MRAAPAPLQKEGKGWNKNHTGIGELLVGKKGVRGRLK